MISTIEDQHHVSLLESLESEPLSFEKSSRWLRQLSAVLLYLRHPRGHGPHVLALFLSSAFILSVSSFDRIVSSATSFAAPSAAAPSSVCTGVTSFCCPPALRSYCFAQLVLSANICYTHYTLEAAPDCAHIVRNDRSYNYWSS